MKPIATFILPKYLGKDLGDEPPPKAEPANQEKQTGGKLLSYAEMTRLYG
jgi:hypothetical protein